MKKFNLTNFLVGKWPLRKKVMDAKNDENDETVHTFGRNQNFTRPQDKEEPLKKCSNFLECGNLEYRCPDLDCSIPCNISLWYDD